MMKYYIAVEEIRSTVVEVDAESESEAMSKIEKAYSEDEICLDEPQYINDDTQFYDETELWMEVIKNGFKKEFQNIK